MSPLMMFSLFGWSSAGEKLAESIALETSEGCTSLIPKGTALPASISHTFSNMQDGQPAVSIRLYQGESILCARNRLLGTFDLPIQPAEKGKAQVQVTIIVGKNKELTIVAQDVATGMKREFSGGVVK